MKIKLLCFGITRDILGQFEKEIELEPQATVRVLKDFLHENYPDFSKLKSLRIALNEEYAEDEQVLSPNDEIVLIPPVSGG
jgi:molybdopterin converting factor subunit 1